MLDAAGIDAAVERIIATDPRGSFIGKASPGDTFVCRLAERWFTTTDAAAALASDFAVAFDDADAGSQTNAIVRRAERVSSSTDAEQLERSGHVFDAFGNVLQLYVRYVGDRLASDERANEFVERLETALTRNLPADAMVLAAATKCRLLRAGSDPAAVTPLLDSVVMFVCYGWIG
jgi:hypothetical protein